MYVTFPAAALSGIAGFKWGHRNAYSKYSKLLTENETVINSLLQQIESKDKLIENLRGQIADRDKIIAELNEKIKQIDPLKEKIKAQGALIHDLQQHHKDRALEVEDYQQQNSDLISKLNKLETEIKNLRNTSEESNKLLNKVEKAIQYKLAACLVPAPNTFTTTSVAPIPIKANEERDSPNDSLENMTLRYIGSKANQYVEVNHPNSDALPSVLIWTRYINKDNNSTPLHEIIHTKMRNLETYLKNKTADQVATILALSVSSIIFSPQHNFQWQFMHPCAKASINDIVSGIENNKVEKITRGLDTIKDSDAAKTYLNHLKYAVNIHLKIISLDGKKIINDIIEHERNQPRPAERLNNSRSIS